MTGDNMQSINFLKGRRLWVVRDVMIWGLAEDAELYYLGLESVEGNTRVMFGRSSVGDSAQDIRFEELTDHIGNQLPSTIAAPRVLIRPRSQYQAYLAGEESGSGFRIARDPAAPGPISVDLFIYETGIIAKAS